MSVSDEERREDQRRQWTIEAVAGDTDLGLTDWLREKLTGGSGLRPPQTSSLLSFLSEAAAQRDPENMDQAVIAVIPEGMITLYGYVEHVSADLLTLERIKRVNNVQLRHISTHPYLHYIPLGKIVMARYSDLSEVRPMNGL